MIGGHGSATVRVKHINTWWCICDVCSCVCDCLSVCLSVRLSVLVQTAKLSINRSNLKNNRYHCYQTLRIIKFRRLLTLTLTLRCTMTERRICIPLGDSLAIVLLSWPGALWVWH